MKEKSESKLYEFIFRGLLTEDALDKSGRISKNSLTLADVEIANILSIDLLDDEHIDNARKMSIVYTAIAAFENSIRELVSGVLLESKGENWWQSVPKSIRDSAESRMEEEKKIKWHTQRGLQPINYTMLGNLLSIMRYNWDVFEPYIQSIEWAGSIFDAFERSRNVIMHSGNLDKEDIERLGIYIRDWIKQVGT